ncbi:uncharacterized protein LOC121375921 isoform X2 [Gigantopelta aegis]|uniref:uncharacterized protein LOC121375921 isoform X2 n=1 Tax=Gigantopelta aegis TaxID=1735272 RepID=UPI001B88B502|nr:uncharacterized protein LOC121375921 isoform X2 [Gigantopelta aegis]
MASIVCRDKWKAVRVCAAVLILGLLVYWLVLYLSQPKVSTTDIFIDCETNFTSTEGTVFIPEESVLKKARLLDLICLYQRYITNIQTVCHRKERLGGLGHGGWDICVVSANPLTTPCLVYSLGINYNFMFDDSIATKYGCEVHSFDPKMGLGEHDHSLRVHFHPAAISNVNKVDSQGRQLYTLEEAQKRLHHQQVYQCHKQGGVGGTFEN